jgi:PAS domain S-box-containing protein
LGITAKLTFAFAAVVLIMVLGNLGYSLIVNLQEGRAVAARKVDMAIGRIENDFHQMSVANRDLALRLTHDQALVNACANQDRSAVASIVKAAMEQRGFAGFVTIVDDKGKIFYSSDSPGKFGFNAKERSAGVEHVFRNLVDYLGPASFTPSGVVTISAMIPMGFPTSRVSGIMIASEALDSEFLIGEATKLTILGEPLTGVDLVLLNGRDGSLVQATPGLLAENSSFLKSLKDNGIRAIPDSPLDAIGNWFSGNFNAHGVFEKSNRWWRQLNLEGVPSRGAVASELVGIILVSAPITNPSGKVLSNLFLYTVTGCLAMLVALVLSAWLNKSISAPLQLMVKRVSDVASQKQTAAATEGLSGDWLKLAELIDESIATMRSSVQSLKVQLARLNQDSEEKKQETQTSDSQFDALNRQVSTQARQLTELSKQVNSASRQSLLLQQKLDAVLQSSAEGFLVLDQFGNVISANPVFLNWMGVTEGEIAGRLCFDLVKKPDEPRNNDIPARTFVKHGGDPHALINQFYPEGVVYHRQSDRSINVLAHLQPVGGPDGTIQGYIMVLRDKSLRSEIAQLKTEIVAMLSDSIRNPLMNAEATWQTIMRNSPQSMHPSVGQSLAELHKQYETLVGVIDSLLMIHGGVMPQSAGPRETFVISRLVADCLEEVGSLARERQLSLDYKSVAGLPNMTGNREAVRAMLIQVLEKMISITAPGGRVRVETIIKGPQVRMSVSSSGPAMPEAELADLFVGFIEGKHAEETYSSRLSMYLARNNVERLGGEVSAESAAGRGTVIYLTLPLG